MAARPRQGGECRRQADARRPWALRVVSTDGPTVLLDVDGEHRRENVGHVVRASGAAVSGPAQHPAPRVARSFRGAEAYGQPYADGHCPSSVMIALGDSICMKGMICIGLCLPGSISNRGIEPGQRFPPFLDEGRRRWEAPSSPERKTVSSCLGVSIGPTSWTSSPVAGVARAAETAVTSLLLR